MAEVNHTVPAHTLQLDKDRIDDLMYRMCEIQSLARGALYQLDSLDLGIHLEITDAKYVFSLIVERTQDVWDKFDNSRLYTVEIDKN